MKLARVRRPNGEIAFGAIHDSQVALFCWPGTLGDLLAAPDPELLANQLLAVSRESLALDAARLLAPIDRQEVWAAGVPIVPFVNYFTEIENEDPILREMDLATMGDPVKNKALYEDRSPIFFVDKIKAPLFLLAGGNDPRCPKSETMQVVEAVKKNGGIAEYKIYENEGHGFSRVENQIDAYRRVADFLQAHVRPADCYCSLKE